MHINERKERMKSGDSDLPGQVRSSRSRLRLVTVSAAVCRESYYVIQELPTAYRPAGRSIKHSRTIAVPNTVVPIVEVSIMSIMYLDDVGHH